MRLFWWGSVARFPKILNLFLEQKQLIFLTRFERLVNLAIIHELLNLDLSAVVCPRNLQNLRKTTSLMMVIFTVLEISRESRPPAPPVSDISLLAFLPSPPLSDATPSLANLPSFRNTSNFRISEFSMSDTPFSFIPSFTNLCYFRKRCRFTEDCEDRKSVV